MAGKLVFLHLSDIHFRGRFSAGPHDLDADLRNEIERDLKVLREQVGVFDLVLVTGDIAFAGQPGEYHTAIEWLAAVCAVVGCPSHSVRVIPGNHDVDRARVQRSKTLRQFRSQMRAVEVKNVDDELRDWLTDASGAALLTHLDAYSTFANRFECGFTVDSLAWQDDLELSDGSILRIVGLNSALISDSDDDDGAHRLVLGSAQYRSIERQDGVEYLVMCHHPPQWIRDQDRYDDIVQSRARVQLFGHRHRQRSHVIDDSLVVYAGAVHPDRREPGWEPRYNVLTLCVLGEPTSRRLEVDLYARIWNEGESKFLPDRAEDGKEYRRTSINLKPWEPMRPPEPLTPAAKSISKKLSGTIMDPSRRLTYRFLGLPYRIRMEIASRLGLLEDEDRGIPEAELYRRFFYRARTKELLAELWEKVEQGHGAGDALENPFKPK